MKHEIIAICGKAGAGKDTVANYLMQHHGYTKESFANSLKDAIAAIFSWDRDMLEGSTNESRQWREQTDHWWATRLGIPELTPRWVLQHWGTDVCRNYFHTDIWIASVERKLLANTRNKIVITDCRFANEHAMIKNCGGTIICVERDMLYIENNKHASELEWESLNFDATISNNGTLASLYEVIDMVLR